MFEKQTKRSPEGVLSSPKDFVFFKGDEIFPQPLSDSQDHFGAREKSILKHSYPISSPNTSFICDVE